MSTSNREIERLLARYGASGTVTPSRRKSPVDALMEKYVSGPEPAASSVEEPNLVDKARGAARAVGRAGLGAVDAALAVARAPMEHSRNPLLRVPAANLRRGAPAREAAMDEAMAGVADFAREGDINLDEGMVAGRGPSVADLLAAGGLAGDVGREAVYAVPTVPVGGVAGRILGAGAARVAPAATGRIASAFARHLPGRMAARTARFNLEAAGTLAPREAIEQGEIDPGQIGETLKHSAVGDLPIPGSDRVIPHFPFFTLGAFHGPGPITAKGRARAYGAAENRTARVAERNGTVGIETTHPLEGERFMPLEEGEAQLARPERGGFEIPERKHIETVTAEARAEANRRKRVVIEERNGKDVVVAREHNGNESTMALGEARQVVADARRVGYESDNIRAIADAIDQRDARVAGVLYRGGRPVARTPGASGGRGLEGLPEQGPLANIEQRAPEILASRRAMGEMPPPGGRPALPPAMPEKVGTMTTPAGAFETVRPGEGPVVGARTVPRSRATQVPDQVEVARQRVHKMLMGEGGFATVDPERAGQAAGTLGRYGALSRETPGHPDHPARMAPISIEPTNVTHLGFDDVSRADDFVPLPGEEIRLPAMRMPDGQIFEAPAHGQALRQGVYETNSFLEPDELFKMMSGDGSGYTTSAGRFIGRRQATDVIEAQGKIAKRLELDSLDLEPVTRRAARQDALIARGGRPSMVDTIRNNWDRANEGIRQAKAQGGITFSNDLTPFAGDQGYVVSLASTVVPENQLSPAALREFASQYEQVLSRHPDLKLGLYRANDGSWSIDLNTVVPDQRVATSAGRALGEESIYGLAEQDLIQTGGKAVAKPRTPETIGQILEAINEELSVSGGRLASEAGFAVVDPEELAKIGQMAGRAGQAAAPAKEVSPQRAAKAAESVAFETSGYHPTPNFQAVRQRTGEFANWVRGFGPPGQKLAAAIERMDRPTQARANSAILDTEQQIFKGATDAELENVVRALHGREVALTTREAALRDKWLPILDRDMNDYSVLPDAERTLKSGKKIEVGGKGFAAPQVPNRVGRSTLERFAFRGPGDAKVEAAIERMMEAGAKTRESAIAQLKYLSDQHIQGVNGYFMRERVLMPEEWVELNPKKWHEGHFYRTARTVEYAKEFGVKEAKAKEYLLGIGEIDKVAAANVERYMKAIFGGARTRGLHETRVLEGLSRFQTYTKLGASYMSGIVNLGQGFVNTATLPRQAWVKAIKAYPPVAQRWMKSARALAEEMERAGAVNARAGALTGDIHARAGQVALRTFTGPERANQIRSALAARYTLEHDIGKLMELGFKPSKPRDLVLRRLQRFGLSDDVVREVVETGRELTADEINEVAWRGVRDLQHPLTPATMRMWQVDPLWKNVGKFKHFQFSQSGFISDYVIKELLKGNAAPALKFFAAAELYGEIISFARSHITGRHQGFIAGDPTDRGATGVVAAALDNLGSAAGLGFLADVTWGISSSIGGPLAGTLANVGEQVVDVAKRPTPNQVNASIEDFVRREVSVVRQVEHQLERLDTWLFDQNRASFENMRARERARQWAEGRSLGEAAVGVVESTLQGRPQYERTDRTKMYRYASRQIDANDIGDAAEYLTEILRGSTGKERKVLIEGIKSSRNRTAPLAAVPKKERAAFFKDVGPQEAATLKKLQAQYIARYNEALRRAKARTRGNP